MENGILSDFCCTAPHRTHGMLRKCSFTSSNDTDINKAVPGFSFGTAFCVHKILNLSSDPYNAGMRQARHNPHGFPNHGQR